LLRRGITGVNVLWGRLCKYLQLFHRLFLCWLFARILRYYP
jgi:hypothetical protein